MPVTYLIDMSDFTKLDEEVNAISCFTEADPLVMNGGTDTISTQYSNDMPSTVFKQPNPITLRVRYRVLQAGGGPWDFHVWFSDGSNYWRMGISSDGTTRDFVTGRTGTRNALSVWGVGPEVVDSADWTGDTGNQWNWIMLRIEDGANFIHYYYPDFGTSLPAVDDAGWIALAPGNANIDYNDELGTLTSVGITGNRSGVSPGSLIEIDDLIITLDRDIEGLDETIKFDSYYIRTALNGGGNAIFNAPAPFYSAVSAATLRTQLKKQITYANAFGIIQFLGETSTLTLGKHGGKIEAEEMIRKTMYTEVGESPVVFSTFLRQWNGLIITDKDGDFVTRGITTSHIVAFSKADTKVYEGRATRDAFTIVQADDFSSVIVPQQVTNGKDEEMYYKDKWDSVDTDKAHIMIDDNTSGAGSENEPWVVKYPVDLYEKFNNLAKLNKLEIKTTISALKKVGDAWKWTGDDGKYHWYVYNYQSVAFEKIKSLGETELGGDSTTSTVYNTAAFYDEIDVSINVIDELKTGVSDWDIATSYSSGDRAIHADILYTYINGTPSSGQEPPGNKWQRTVYDFINYESTAGSAAIFSKLNCIAAIMTTKPFGIASPFIHGFWIWDFSVKATFDEDNEPEYSSASISAVTATTITLNATSGINLPEKDGFGVGDIVQFVKSSQDYLQDAWDNSVLPTNIGVLSLNITNGGTIGVLEDHTYKSFFILMQHISELTNSTFWANYDFVSTVKMESADNHSSTGLTITREDIEGYNSEQWSITWDATKQRNQIRILGDNVNYLKTITPDNDPFDLGDEIEIKEDSSIQTLLQASDLATSMSPRFVSSEVIASVTLNYSQPKQDYSAVKVGKTIALKLPTSSDTSIANFSTGNDGELLIIAIELNKNDETGDQDHATLTLQRRYS